MIYSAAFDALPDAVRERVYRRLYNILAGQDRNVKLAGLSLEDRRDILEILGDTKTNLPKWWGGPVTEQAPVP
jgi:hypothetical protein